MKLKNIEINNIIAVLMASDSVINNPKIKLPHAVRHALRMNIQSINSVFEIYKQEIKDIVDRYVSEGRATIFENGSFKVKPDAVTDINKEFAELGAVENEVAVEEVDADVMENVLKNNDMSMAEEDIFRLFTKEK